MPRKWRLLCLILSVIVTLPLPKFFPVAFLVISWILRYVLSRWQFDFPASEYEELPEDGWPICFLVAFSLTVMAWLSRLGTLVILDLVAAFSKAWLSTAFLVWLVFKLKGKT